MATEGIDTGQACLLAEPLEALRESLAEPIGSDPYLERLIRRLERHPEQKASLEDMAGDACISKYHLVRRFKEETGLTPHRFLIQNRVRKAQRLLGESGDMAEVALAAGFCDQSHFIRHFQRLIGLTPTAYRSSYTAVSLPLPLMSGRG